MMNIETIFNTIIEQHLNAGAKIVLGLSGGLDSRVLLELMARYQGSSGVECLAVHVHHGLSPNADEWAQKCADWCQHLGIRFAVEKVQLETFGRSIEESAREARYVALDRHLAPNDLLITGQHADDQLETFLLAAKRGSGPRGLSSMAQCMPFGKAKLVRPLLSVSRQEIERYGQDKQLDWVEDESNQDQRFERNFVRHSLTPVMAQRWPHIRQSVLRTTQLCAEQEQLLDELVLAPYQQSLFTDGSLLISALQSHSSLLRARIVRMWLESWQVRMPSRELLATIWQEVALAQPDANPQLQLGSAQVRRYSNRLYIVKEWQSLQEWQQEVKFDQYHVLPDSLGTMALLSSKAGRLSKQALSQAGLRIIFNPEGLSAHPAERGHSRKLKKLFQEYGVPSWLRRRTPILMCGDQVVAVGELFIDRHFIGQDCELVWDMRKRFM